MLLFAHLGLSSSSSTYSHVVVCSCRFVVFFVNLLEVLYLEASPVRQPQKGNVALRVVQNQLSSA